MNVSRYTDDVGSPDPELTTSPIAEEGDDETEVLRLEMPGEPVCYFNGKSYPNGASVKSGSAILKCSYGIWIPAGPADS